MFMSSDRLVLAVALQLLVFAPPASAEAARTNETVVILHGMGRTRASMLVLMARYKEAGYEALNFPYSTTGASLDETSDSLAAFLEKSVKTERYHLIGHSLGNIIIRHTLRTAARPGLGRVVMLAPPNRPARLAKLLKGNRLFHWLTGDNGRKLADDEFYRTLPAPPVEFGVIAGDKGQSLTFDGPNDGVVDVEGTKLEGMKDFATVHHTHTFLMNAKDTFTLSKRFLESGRFEESKAGP